MKLSLSIKICWIIVVLLLYLDVLLFCFLLIRRVKNVNSKNSSKIKMGKMLNHLFQSSGISKKDIGEQEYERLSDLVKIEESTRNKIENQTKRKKIFKKYVRRLSSSRSYRRAEASIILGKLSTKEAKQALEKAIVYEKNYPVKLYMANALSDIGEVSSIPVLVNSLIGAHRWYRDKVNMLIADFGEEFLRYFPEIRYNHRIEMQELIIDFATVYDSNELKEYLVWLINHKEQELNRINERYGSSDKQTCANCQYYIEAADETQRVCKYNGMVKADFWCKKYKLLPVSIYTSVNLNKAAQRALDVLVKTYPFVLVTPEYLNSKDLVIKNAAIRALAYCMDDKSLAKLHQFLREDNLSESATLVMIKIIEEYPEQIKTIVGYLENEDDFLVKQRLARVLSGKIEYFIMSLLKKDAKTERNIIQQILTLGLTSETIDFLNKNKNIELENEVISILKDVLLESEKVKNDVSVYLEERLCEKCGLKRVAKSTEKRVIKKDKSMMIILISILISVILLPPILYCIRHYDILFSVSAIEQLKIFVVDFNYYLAYYSITINGIYFLLLIMSFYQVNRQFKTWKMKPKTMLFKNKMLPSISIIAPAFNEELTILENVNSLLNLEYPDYELIIINDGSSDSTLEKIITYFDLKRVDLTYEFKLKTKQILGIYLNPSLPKLTVIDKMNGGKADSLNAGINYSKKEYFCGIDADSVLERDALLKLSSLTIDQSVETPALGGNVYPINGCVVEKGYISEKHIPKKNIAKFQNIEYIRAFMSGRLGWASINSLLIISGAFGLFRKERIIGIGGYLTQSGKYEKDTVGEDMELVVRIRRLMRELKLSFKICYAFNANCWTEVPEDRKSLRKQRYRWHRGLIEILVFHRKMMFNPQYGRTGIIAIPYFFLFEMIGPILEMEGYLMVVVAIVFGMLNQQIALLLFISSILLGTLISISSLVIAEKDVIHFRTREICILIFCAFVENFGPRQILSLWRVGGYFKMFGKNSGWGKPKRKGFSNQEGKEF